MRKRRFGWSALVLFAGLCWMAPARADILPDPKRPKDWDEHPAPTPEVPLDESFARRLLPFLALGMAGCTAAAAVHRSRVSFRARRAR